PDGRPFKPGCATRLRRRARSWKTCRIHADSGWPGNPRRRIEPAAFARLSGAAMLCAAIFVGAPGVFAQDDGQPSASAGGESFMIPAGEGAELGRAVAAAKPGDTIVLGVG